MMNDIRTCSAIILPQDIMPLVSSNDICPGTQPTQITKAEGLATEQNITAQRNTICHKKGFNETTHISSAKGVEEA
jgi:hypothetical protein